MARTSEKALERIEQRLRADVPYWAEACFSIVDEEGERRPFVFRNAQLKLWQTLAAQRAAGQPMRAIVLKSRRRGISSSGTAIMAHRCTTLPNRRGLIVAQDVETPGELFDIAMQGYAHIPEPPHAPEWLKPGIISQRNSMGSKGVHWGNPSRLAQRRGDYGINSSLRIDTAQTVETGRGKTITDLWISEMAFWPNPKKGLSLLNAVFDRPDTLVVVESTANGHNAFKGRWDRAVRGEGRFAAVFVGWTDDENCREAFGDADELARFVESVGTGEWGEDEPALLRRMGADPGAIDPVRDLRALEALKWRRLTIVDKCDGKLELFQQEYPSTPEEAFIASGKHVFSMSFVSPVVESTKETEPQAVAGVLMEAGVRSRRTLTGEIEVPTGALWVPRSATGFAATHDFWQVWTLPCGCPARDGCGCEGTPQNGRWIIGADVSDALPDEDWHAVQVVDHVTGAQAAQYRSRVNPDLLARQILLAAMYFNRAWIGVEITGGHGLPIARRLHDDYGYPLLYKRKAPDTAKARTTDRLGWDTNRRTKPMMLDEMNVLLREGTHGIRAHSLALELTTYVHLPDGSQGADSESYDDLLMSWGQAQMLRRLIPVPHRGSSGPAVTRRAPQRPRI